MGKVYFASDMHLGYPDLKQGAWREQLFVKWLNAISADADELYLVGDVFDFWFEYHNVVPKGFVRTLGKLAQMVESGIKVHFFAGNHDSWTFGYLRDEIGLIVHDDWFETEIRGKRFYISHGDGVGPGDYTYKFIKWMFHNRIVRFLFRNVLPPDWGVWYGHKWSNSSRGKKGIEPLGYLGDDKEKIVLHSNELLKTKTYDYMVYGHRHLVVDKQITETTRLIELGDWLSNFSYGVFDGQTFQIVTNYDKISNLTDTSSAPTDIDKNKTEKVF